MKSQVQRSRQFLAVLKKNFILQTRGRRSFLGVSGWGALMVQIMLPVAFFSLMCIPKYYIQPYQHPLSIQSQEYDVDTKWWAGASPYEGPAYKSGGNAQVMFVPDTPEVRSLITRVAMAVSCPAEPYKRICSSSSITTFPCMFGVNQAPAECKDSTVCMRDPACYAPALNRHFRIVNSEDEAMQLIQQEPDSVDAVVVFTQATVSAAGSADNSTVHKINLQQSKASPPSSNGDGQLLEYVIRMNSSDVPPTQLLQDMFDVSPGVMPLPGNLLWEYRRYWFFMNLQLGIDRALLGGQQSNSSFPANLSVKIKPFPWPARQEDLGAATAAAFFNLLLVYAFLAPTRAVVGSIVREKELRLREGMKILGLSESAYWYSWSLTHWLTLAASGLLCTLVGKYPFSHSSLVLMLCFYWLFSAALISFSYFLSTLFSTSRVAGTATQFIYALSMIPGFLLPFIRPYGGLSWYLASLLPTSAASLFAAALVNWERVAAGVQWDTLWLPVTQGSRYCVGSVLWLLLLDVLLYGALTWYCDKVIPSSYGQTQPPWFFLQPSFWRTSKQTSSNSCSRSAGRNSRANCHDAEVSLPLTSAAADSSSAAVVSSIPTAGEPYVQTLNLRRVFRGVDGSSRVAVEGLDLKMYAGRITALLGHNGAGKTTTIHMLTGMLQPTSGTALVAGADITVDMPTIRQSLGICPQFDILWPDLTVLEHLVLYAVIKGARGAQAGAEARRAAAEIGLLEKLSSLASELSGGQRRKLSVAIAFLGAPAVVFLDEPTSGMDPYSRRATWEVIKSRRSSSVIVLTTHSMEEADLLCDDIHIMAEGRLVASGTPLNLKTQYGVGYTLTVVLKSSSVAARSNGAGLASNAAGDEDHGSNPTAAIIHNRQSSFTSVESLMHLILNHVPSAELLSAAGAEVSVRLPQDDSSAFAALLRSLDAAASSLAITSYGLSVTTLEEVFLAIADQAVFVRHKPRHRRSLSTNSNISSGWGSWGAPAAGAAALQPGCKVDPSSSVPVDGTADTMLEGLPLYWQQFKALFVKRMLCARRDRLAVITQLLVPLLLVLLAMIVSTLQTSHHQQPQLDFERRTCLFGSPALLAAAPAVRQQVEFRGLMDGYSRSDIVDTQYTQLYHGSAGLPLNLTLEGQLLSQFFSGSPHYDGLYLQHMPPLDQLLTSLGEPPVMTILVNQSAISGLPAALNQVTTALLRVLVAAGGGKGHPAVGGISTMTPVDNSITEGVTSSRSSHISAAVLNITATNNLNSLINGGISAVNAAKHRSLQAISIHNFSSSAAACDASSCSCVGQRRLPSCLPRIRVSSAPLPLLPGEGAERVREDAGALMLVLCMTLAGSVLSASFVVYLVREQENNSKHLQLVSGASATAYWLANYCWDLLNFSLPAAGIVLLVWAYHQPQLTGIRLAAMAVLLWVFGAAGINLTYLCHFLFKDEMKALQRLNTGYFLVGYLGFTTTWVLSLIARVMAKPALSAATDQLKGVLRVLSPHYCFAQGLYDITNTYPGTGGLPVPGFGPEGPHNPFNYSVLGTAVVHLLGQAVVFGSAALLHDVGLTQLLRPLRRWLSSLWLCAAQQLVGQNGRRGRNSARCSDMDNDRYDPDPQIQQQQQQQSAGLSSVHHHRVQWGAVVQAHVGDSEVNGGDADSHNVCLSTEDDDVAAERIAVQAGLGFDDAMVVLNGISKTYQQGYGLPAVKAVTGLWLRIMPGECFGLLGVNGAGKTTTFKILTGETSPDAGDTLIARHSVLTQLATARRNLGYCPQFDALPSAMTGREVLHMYARLRGVDGEDRVQQMAQQLLDELGLLDYADTVCGAYSGGNKRKLNVAVALVGGPPLVLLDEPSTGMDPSARRFLWRVLQSEVLCAGRTIILTSHSMEEVDALASRLVIMAAGAATCLGTPQHLKSRFGDGYTLELRLTRNNSLGQVSPEESQEAAQAQQITGSSVEAISAATAAAEQHFMMLMPGATVLEKEPGRLLLRLPISSTVVGSDSTVNNRSSSAASTTDVQHAVGSLADVFECIESCKQQLGIAEYSLSQSSLERVFLALAKAASHVAE